MEDERQIEEEPEIGPSSILLSFLPPGAGAGCHKTSALSETAICFPITIYKPRSERESADWRQARPQQAFAAIKDIYE
jgi:hypothetical protein